MKRIEMFDTIKTAEDIEKTKVSPWLINAYFNSIDRELDYIDLRFVEKGEIKRIADDLKHLGIENFTISSGYSGLLEALQEFEKNGCKLVELITIHADHPNYGKNLFGSAPAVLMSVNK